MADLLRIQKYLAQQGYCSRREAERWISKGWVYLNGTPVTQQGVTCNPDQDTVSLAPEAHAYLETTVTIKYYKPRGIVTHSPQPGEQAIADIIDPTYKHLAPVGRLDKDSEGLIMLTNQGVLAKKWLDPSNPHARVYEIKVSKPMTSDMIKQCEEGVQILGKKTKPCQLKMLAPLRYEITLYEGRNRQIRRMIQHVGNMVVRLKRMAFDGIKLGDLKPNDYELYR